MCSYAVGPELIYNSPFDPILRYSYIDSELEPDVTLPEHVLGRVQYFGLDHPLYWFTQVIHCPSQLSSGTGSMISSLTSSSTQKAARVFPIVLFTISLLHFLNAAD